MKNKKFLRGVFVGVFSYTKRKETDSQTEKQKVVTPINTNLATPTTSLPVTIDVVPSVASVYVHTYNIEAVVYEPNASEFVGFWICDTKNSMCTVYGVKNSEIAKAVLGGKYQISFNETKSCGVAVGTTYCEVVGDFAIRSL